jgi:hypothetical protein
MIVKFQVDVNTDLPPSIIREAILDFTPRRTEIWTMLSKKFYKVNATGDGWADVIEGSDKPTGVWAHERYEWNSPAVDGSCSVKWSVLESNFSNQIIR